MNESENNYWSEYKLGQQNEILHMETFEKVDIVSRQSATQGNLPTTW